MNPDHPRAVLLQRTALICALLVFSIVGISAYIRLSAAGLGCSPWPQCYGQALPATPSATIDVLRLMHRFLAVALLPLLLLLLIGGFARKPNRWERRWTAVWALVVTLFLAVLGRWTAGGKIPAIALGNLLGGFLLFALCARMAFPALRHDTASPSTRARRWRHAASGAVVVQVALGGLVSSGLAGLSCPDLWACAPSVPFSWDALNPWQVPLADPSVWPINPQGALVHLLHRLMGLITVVLVAVAAWRPLHAGHRRTGVVLLALITLQLALGILLVVAGLPLAAALAHNLVAALLLASLLALP